MSGPAIIPFHTGKSEMLGSEQPGELLYTLEQTPPNTGPSATGYTAGTPLTWTFKPSNGKWWIPSETYLEVRMSVWGATGDNTHNLEQNQITTDGNTNKSLAPLAPACLFDSLGIEVNGKQIESLNTNVAQHSAIRFRLSNRSEQRAEGKNSLWGEAERIVPNAQVTSAALGANTYIPLGTQLVPVTQSAIDRQAIFSQARTQTLAFKLPLAVFHQPLPVPSANFRITAQITNQFARALQTVYESTLANAIAAATVSDAVSATVQILNLDMYVAYADYGSSGMYNGNLVIPTNPLWITSYALSTSSYSDQFTITGLPQTAKQYGFALQRATANSGTANNACSPTEFHINRAVGRSGFAPVPTATGQNITFALTAFQATIGGRIGPNPQAKLYYSQAENNLHKWYRRYEHACGLEEPESFEQWLARGPIYMFSSLQIHTPDDRADSMVVRMERDQTVNVCSTDAAAVGTYTLAPYAVPTNCLVFAVAEKALVCEVKGGEIVDVTEIDR